MNISQVFVLIFVNFFLKWKKQELLQFKMQCCLFDSWIREVWKNRIPIRDEKPGSYFRDLRNQFFGLTRIRDGKNSDPGWTPRIRNTVKIKQRSKVCFTSSFARTLPGIFLSLLILIPRVYTFFRPYHDLPKNQLGSFQVYHTLHPIASINIYKPLHPVCNKQMAAEAKRQE